MHIRHIFIEYWQNLLCMSYNRAWNYIACDTIAFLNATQLRFTGGHGIRRSRRGVARLRRHASPGIVDWHGRVTFCRDILFSRILVFLSRGTRICHGILSRVKYSCIESYFRVCGVVLTCLYGIITMLFLTFFFAQFPSFLCLLLVLFSLIIWTYPRVYTLNINILTYKFAKKKLFSIQWGFQNHKDNFCMLPRAGDISVRCTEITLPHSQIHDSCDFSSKILQFRL